MDRRVPVVSISRGALLGLLVVVIPLVLGWVGSIYLLPRPQVAVIEIDGDIWEFYTDHLEKALTKAEKDRAVRAVVLDISSPGGEVTASEELYLHVLKVRQSKPVVVSIDQLALSGGYYVASAADQIYAKSSSMVGNIGAVSILPDPDLVDEHLITTGPFKLSGGSEVEYIRRMELLKNSFLAAILAQRKERLRVGPETLARGEVYLGLQAREMGLVDEIGSQSEAIAAAAKLARVRSYSVIDMSPEFPQELVAIDIPDATAATLAASPGHLPPGFYYRFVEPLP